MTVDSWGGTLEADEPGTVDAWNRAWTQALHFTGDPFATLAEPNDSDATFALGSVFCGTYRVLGGARPDDTTLRVDLERARSRAISPLDVAHVQALEHLVEGNFTKAGRQWDQIASAQRDFAAIRFAHDVYLHVGDEARRLQSSQRAFDSWARSETGWGFIAGQLSFALEEAGFYDDAEDLASEALQENPLDLWARHSLAHLYETTDDSEAAFSLLRDQASVWAEQDSLAVHIWWHLALRLIASGSFDEALAVHDSQLDVATTPFRICDLASLLWRLELAGVDVADRWDELADRFASRPEWHTSGFLDLHGALIYTRRPDHDAAHRFFEGVGSAHGDGASENDHIFVGTVRPLVSAIRDGAERPSRAVDAIDAVADTTHRIGGSIAQRDLIGLTRTHFEQLSQHERVTPITALEAQ